MTYPHFGDPTVDRPLDLEALEQRAFRSRFDDGLLDLIVGLFLLAMGATMGTEWGGMAGIWAAVLLPQWYVLRKTITEPRVGYVQFGPTRQSLMRRKMLIMTLALGGSVLAGLVMWFLQARKDPALIEMLRPWGPTPFGLMLALMIGIGAALLGIGRGYVYAALIVVCVTGGHSLGFDLGPTLVVPGVVVTLWGAVLLRRFIVANPKQDPQLDRESRDGDD